MYYFDVDSRGFLPNTDPVERIDDDIEDLVQNLPEWMEKGTVRKELLNNLSFDFSKHFSKDVSILERCFAIFCYFASAYVHSPNEEKTKLLPQAIACPLTELSIILGRKPILSYASYCLTNWRRIDKEKPIELGNIELLQNFSHGEFKEDESWFILVHVEIEAQAAEGIKVIKEFLIDDKKSDIFNPLLKSLVNMNSAMNRMPEHCRPDVYFNKVRPYIFGFEDIVYERCWDGKPQNYRGETGAQSSIIPAIQTALGIKHKDSMLTMHLKDMRNYMPFVHSGFLTGLESKTYSLRDYAKDNYLEYKYNSCLEQFISFRKRHLEYAVNYIEKKVKDPKGTGGTPYIPWLSNLIKESEEYYI